MRYAQNKLIALTFDDGPSDTTTGHVLDVLARHGIVGTFFLIGDNITDERLPIIKMILALGCEIENHSKTHSDMTTLTREEIVAEIKYTTDRIIEVTGRTPEFFRPPLTGSFCFFGFWRVYLFGWHLSCLGFTEFLESVLFFFFFLIFATPYSMQDLSSLTRD